MDSPVPRSTGYVHTTSSTSTADEVPMTARGDEGSRLYRPSTSFFLFSLPLDKADGGCRSARAGMLRLRLTRDSTPMTLTTTEVSSRTSSSSRTTSPTTRSLEGHRGRKRGEVVGIDSDCRRKQVREIVDDEREVPSIPETARETGLVHPSQFHEYCDETASIPKLHGRVLARIELVRRHALPISSVIAHRRAYVNSPWRGP